MNGQLLCSANEWHWRAYPQRVLFFGPGRSHERLFELILVLRVRQLRGKLSFYNVPEVRWGMTMGVRTTLYHQVNGKKRVTSIIQNV